LEKTRKDLKEPADQLKRAVGELVRGARKRAGYTSAEDAAEAIGVSFTALYELERGKSWISAEMAAALNATLNIPVASFFQGFGSKVDPTPDEALDVIRKALELRANASAIRPIERKVLDSLAALNDAEAAAAGELLLAMLPGFLEGLRGAGEAEGDSDGGSEDDSEELG
jgi:transcriptional regulator with XRE-family HTH domain